MSANRALEIMNEAAASYRLAMHLGQTELATHIQQLWLEAARAYVNARRSA